MSNRSFLLAAAAALVLAHGLAHAQAAFGGGAAITPPSSAASAASAPAAAAPTAPPPQPAEPAPPTFPREQTEQWWSRLRAGGHVLLAIHAATDPATRDDHPPGMMIGLCSTQRNLSAAGREDARRLATVLRQRNVAIDRVVSGETCRARETAQLAFGELSRKPVEFWDRLNEHSRMVNAPALQSLLPAYTAEIRLFATGFSGPGNLVLVMHPYNAEPLLKGSIAWGLQEGEFAVLRAVAPGRYEVVGRIHRDAW